MKRIAGPVDAAIAEQICAQLVRILRVAFAANIEARVIQIAVIFTDRQKRFVIAFVDDVHRRRLFAREARERIEVHAAVARCRARQQRLSVLAGDIDDYIRHRRAGLDRLHEDVLAAVQRFFCDDAQIGDDDQARIAE